MLERVVFKCNWEDLFIFIDQMGGYTTFVVTNLFVNYTMYL
jgi:hypothetical protein